MRHPAQWCRPCFKITQFSFGGQRGHEAHRKCDPGPKFLIIARFCRNEHETVHHAATQFHRLCTGSSQRFAHLILADANMSAEAIRAANHIALGEEAKAAHHPLLIGVGQIPHRRAERTICQGGQMGLNP